MNRALYWNILVICITVWSLFGIWIGGISGDSTSALQSVESMLKQEEGFRSHPYPDTRGNLTIGYGTNISEGITIHEAEYLLTERLRQIWKDLSIKWPPYNTQSLRIRAALLDMAYQLGVAGLLGFKDMLEALKRGDYPAAMKSALDSAWARETPNRARRVVRAFVKQKP